MILRNYLALYCCVYEVIRLAFPVSKKMLIEFNVDRTRKKKQKGSKVKLTNDKTGEKKIFDSIDRVADFLRLKY
nr:hypothetical protein [Clostridioides difficile]